MLEALSNFSYSVMIQMLFMWLNTVILLPFVVFVYIIYFSSMIFQYNSFLDMDIITIIFFIFLKVN